MARRDVKSRRHTSSLTEGDWRCCLRQYWGEYNDADPHKPGVARLPVIQEVVNVKRPRLLEWPEVAPRPYRGTSRLNLPNDPLKTGPWMMAKKPGITRRRARSTHHAGIADYSQGPVRLAGVKLLLWKDKRLFVQMPEAIRWNKNR